MHVLTPLQYDVCRLEAVGLPRDEIARRTGLRRPIVSRIVTLARRRLGVQGRRELAAVLVDCEVRQHGRRGRPSAHGLRPGDPIRVTGGHYAGRVGVYVATHNSLQWRVQFGGGTYTLFTKFIERINQGAPHA